MTKKSKSNNNKSDVEFDKLLLEAIDDAFDSLGTCSKKAIYTYLKDRGISKKAIPLDIDAFSAALYNLFGLGATLVEILIIKNLNMKDNSKLYWKEPNWLVPDLTLSKYLFNKKRCWQKQANIQFEVFLNLEEIRERNR